jgi:SpoVK/Ycf46/Vps4 family AAA+-type ATPase
LPFLSVSAPSIVSGMSGESEKTLRETFDEAKVSSSSLARATPLMWKKLAPCILFLDEVDAITPKRETAQREMERRIVAQLLTCMDGKFISLTRQYTSVPLVLIGRPRDVRGTRGHHRGDESARLA